MFSRYIVFLAILACVPAWAVSPSVTNVQATQLQDASRKVKVTYYLTDPDSSSVYVSLTISTDNGSTYTITPSLATGDIGWVRTGGTRTIYWDAKSQYPAGKWTNCKAKITADDSSGGVYPGTMIYIPAGSFLMGNSGIGDDASGNSDEFPRHSVYLSGYWIGKYEVTRGEYRQFMNAGGYANPAYWSTAGWSWKGSRTEPYYWAGLTCFYHGPTGCNKSTCWYAFTQTDSHPVVNVTYYEAEAFCKWAGGRLPTEAEWERAARWTGSHANVYPWGDTWNQEYCNNYYDSNPAGGGYGKYQTTPVGSYSSYGSPSGCQDMAGNVWEWCKDWYGSTYYSTSPPSNPQGPSSGNSHVLRGGGWHYDVNGDTRCAFRGIYDYNPTFYFSHSGFRLVR